MSLTRMHVCTKPALIRRSIFVKGPSIRGRPLGRRAPGTDPSQIGPRASTFESFCLRHGAPVTVGIPSTFSVSAPRESGGGLTVARRLWGLDSPPPDARSSFERAAGAPAVPHHLD